MGRVTNRCQEQRSLSHVAMIQFLPRNGESVDAKSVRRGREERRGGEERRRRGREERGGGEERRRRGREAGRGGGGEGRRREGGEGEEEEKEQKDEKEEREKEHLQTSPSQKPRKKILLTLELAEDLLVADKSGPLHAQCEDLQRKVFTLRTVGMVHGGYLQSHGAHSHLITKPPLVICTKLTPLANTLLTKIHCIYTLTNLRTYQINTFHPQ